MAACLSVSHGANTIGGATNIFATAYAVYTHKSAVGTNIAVPMWLRGMGAAGLALGCLTYSYNPIAMQGGMAIFMHTIG